MNKKHTGKGVFAATALAKVMSDKVTGELELRVGPPAYDPHNNVLYLPGIPADDVPEDALTLLRAYLAHEAAERGFSKWNPRDPRWWHPDPAKDKPGLRGLVNCLNDARIDHIQRRRFPGAGFNLDEALRFDIKTLLDKNRKQPLQPSVNLVGVLCRYLGEGLMTFDQALAEFPQLEPYLRKVETEMRGLEQMGKMEMDALLDCKFENRLIDMAMEMYAKLKEPPPPEQDQPQQQGLQDGQIRNPQGGQGDGNNGSGEASESASGENQGNGGGGSNEPSGDRSENGDQQGGQGQGGSKSQGDGEGDDEDGDGAGGGGQDDGDESQGQAGVGNGEDGEWDGDDADEPLGDQQGGGGGQQGGSQGDPNGQSQGGGTPSGDPHDGRGDPHHQGGGHGDGPGYSPLDDQADTDHDIAQSMLNQMVDQMFGGQKFDNESQKNYYASRPRTYTYDPRRDRVVRAHPKVALPRSVYAREAQVLETKMRQVLTMPAPRMIRNRDKGEVDERAIHRLCMGDTNVMKRRVKVEADSVACSVSWDESYSMAGTPIKVVQQLAFVFNEALGKLGIPTEMLGWTTAGIHCGNHNVYRQDALRHMVYKEFKDRWNDEQTLKRLGAIHAYGYTPTAEGLMFAAKRLSERRERRKVLFFLTDGQPGMGVNGDPQVHIDFIHTVMRRCELAGIEVVGVGIKYDVTRLFPRSIVVKEVSELRGAVSDELLKILKEGKQQVLARAS